MLKSELKRINVLIVLFLLPVMVFIFLGHYKSFYTLILVGLLCLLLAKLLNLKYDGVIALYLAYVFMALVVYNLLNLVLPQYKGFTGDWGFGTDDLYFFHQATGFNPVNDDGAPLVPFASLGYNFSKFLRVFSLLIPYKTHLIDMLIFNIVPLVFIPHILIRIAKKLFHTDKHLNLLFIASAVCPFMMMNGLVLIRDAWVAFCFILLLWGAVEKKYITVVISISLIAFIRFEAGMLAVALAAVILIFHYLDRNESIKGYVAGMFTGNKKYVTIAVIVLILIGGSILIGTYLFRSHFLTEILVPDVQIKNRDSVYHKIVNSAWYIRLPVGFVFFWGAPFVSLKNLYVNGIFVVRSVFEQLFGILFLFYIPVYFKSLFTFFQRSTPWLVRSLHVAYLAGILIISQMSLQVRHKTMLMPLFYLILYTGLISDNKTGKRVGIVLSLVLLAVEIAVNIKFFI